MSARVTRTPVRGTRGAQGSRSRMGGLARGLSRKRPHPGSEVESGSEQHGTPKVARSEFSEW